MWENEAQGPLHAFMNFIHYELWYAHATHKKAQPGSNPNKERYL